MARRNCADPMARTAEMPANMQTENAIAIQAKRVTKQFGEEYAVRDATFDVPAGKIFGFIGPSGSGKTTTVRLFTGYHAPTEGQVTVLNDTPARFNPRTKKRIGYMTQLFALYPDLTVRENLNFSASLYGMNWFRRKRLKSLLDFVELAEHQSKRARNISGGMQRRLSLAATLVHNPTLIFLDEPTAGIDPVLRRKFWDYFHQLRNEGRTLFVTTQYVSEAAYCDLIGVMAKGRLLMVDTPDGLRNRAYAGNVVDLRTEEVVTSAQMATLELIPGVRRVTGRLDDNGLRLVVKEARTAIPEIMQWCNQNQVNVRSVEEYVPPFDDVFVEILKKENASQ